MEYICQPNKGIDAIKSNKDSRGEKGLGLLRGGIDRSILAGCVGHTPVKEEVQFAFL